MNRRWSMVGPVLLLFATRVASSVAASPRDAEPGSYELDPGLTRVSIPFDVYRDDIRMAAEVDGKPVHLLLDNGVLWDQLLFWGGPQVEALGLEPDGTIDVGGSGEDDRVPSTTASGVEVRFPGIVFRNQDAVIMPSSGGFDRMWTGSVGQISAAFFKHFVVDVNWDSGIITLIPPAEFIPDEQCRALAMRSMGDGSYAVPVTLEIDDRGPFEQLLRLDLGYGLPLQLVAGETTGIQLPTRHMESSLGFGVQGEIHGAFGRVKRIVLAGFELRQVIAGFITEQVGNPVDQRSYLGLPVMERFNMSFDYSRGLLHLRPSKAFGDAFHVGMSGLRLRSAEDGAGLVVVEVVPHSAAAKAGVRPGDLVLKLDGRSLAGVESWELQSELQREGAQVKLELRRQGKPVTTSLVLTPLI